MIEDIEYIPNCLSKELATNLQNALEKELAWHQGDVFIFGKWHKIPRLQAFHGDSHVGYKYSGKELHVHPWTPALLEIKTQLERLNFAPNAMLGNWYRDGGDKMGWHRDNEPELGKTPTILSVSLGATRDFQLRHIHTKERHDIPLEHGSVLVMQGRSQQYWEHQLPARKRIHEGRINLTFRTIIR